MKALRKWPSFTTRSLHIYDSRLMTDGAIYCNRCGSQNSALAKFCANCGTPFSTDAANTLAAPGEAIPRPQGPAQPPPGQPPLQAAAAMPPPMYLPRVGAARYGGL